MHINDPLDINASQLLDSVEALGLKQYIHSPTHKNNNTLDLLMRNELSVVKPIYIKLGPYYLDHCAITALYNIEKNELPITDITFWDLKNVNHNALLAEMDINNVNGDDLDSILKNFEDKILLALDKLTPLKMIHVAVRDHKPCYNNSLRTQLRKVHNRERIWRKYKAEHQWMAYKTELGNCNNLLFMTKCDYIRNKILQNKGDTKKLYSLVSNLTGVKKENPLLECVSDEVWLKILLFSSLTKKTSKIRNDLDKYRLYDPSTSVIHAPLSFLLPINETKTCQTVRKLKNKSCELDYLPTNFIKEHMEHFAKILT